MQEKEAKSLYQQGTLTQVEIQRAADDGGWTVKLKSDDPDGPERVLASKRNRSLRVFKTTDAAVRWCQNMGFGHVQISLPVVA